MDKNAVFLLRADQYQHDPSDWFVLPAVDITPLNSGNHPIRLIGSRGSGKTMILRSIAGKPLGESIPDNSYHAKNRLRIYIRPDNQLMGALKGWGLNEPIWKAASIELMLLRIFEEAASKINYWLEKRGRKTLHFNEKRFCFAQNGEDLSEWIRIKQHALYKWARSPHGHPPIIIAALNSLSSLIKSLEKHIETFPEDLPVSVYFDEQETYLEYHQVIINDWIKNPPLGWVFHVAHRRYLEYVDKTSTDEIIDPSNDFRIIDLDYPLVSSQSESKRDREGFYEKIIKYEVRGLKDDEAQFDYKNFSPKILLPSYQNKMELSNELRNNSYAQEAWRRLTENSIKFSRVKTKNAINKGKKVKDSRLWVVWPILVARNEIENLDIESKKIKNFLHNHFNGAILQIYFESKGRAPMDFYSGFSSICSIVLSNVREFILILQQAIEYELQRHIDTKRDFIEILKRGISTNSQYRSVMTRSKHFNDIVAISAQERGIDIEQALDNWFTFFSICQRLPNLPYNEPNHIICKDSIDELSSAWEIINAGEKHGAFIYTLSSKQRGNTKENQRDIRIHPLLLAKHYLSYAKRNTPPLDFETISLITTTHDKKLIKEIAQRQRNKKENNLPIQGTLFGE
jgi:hypothetical protein